MLREMWISTTYYNSPNSPTQVKRSEEYFLHQIEVRESCFEARGILELRHFSCDTKHLILVYEYMDLGPLHTIIADNVRSHYL